LDESESPGAAGYIFEFVRSAVQAGSLVDSLPPIADPLLVGIGQSIGGFITIIQEEPSGYPGSADVTLVVIPKMAHMHNFTDTRIELWDRFLKWLPT